MKGLRKTKISWLLWAAMASLVPAIAQADNNFEAGVVDPAEQQRQNAAPVDDDSPGFIRRNTWTGSFDNAGDATREAEVELKKGVTIECKEENFNVPGSTPQLVAQRMADCQRLQQESQSFAQDAEGIRKMQRAFSVASKASDVAAVGAIGAVGSSSRTGTCSALP